MVMPVYEISNESHGRSARLIFRGSAMWVSHRAAPANLSFRILMRCERLSLLKNELADLVEKERPAGSEFENLRFFRASAPGNAPYS
jgi:hypothetical protein